MSNFVAVWGANGSGKTSIALSLAGEIYNANNGEKKVCVLFSDDEVPVIPYVFQNENITTVKSLGDILSSDDINDEELFNSLITMDSMKNIGFMGYQHGESTLSYPKLAELNVKKLFDLISLFFDVVIVDVMSNSRTILSQYSLAVSDKTVVVLNSDVKSLSWFDSQLKPRFHAEMEQKMVMVINHLDDYLLYPDNEISILCGGVKHVIPFSLKLRQNSLDGRLLREKMEKNYEDSIRRIVKEIEGKIGN